MVNLLLKDSTCHVEIEWGPIIIWVNTLGGTRCSCVRSFVWNSVDSYPRFIHFALGSIYAVHISVLRKEEHVCSSNTIPYTIPSKIAILFTFTFAKLGISPPTRCLRCATDGSAQSIDCAARLVDLSNR